MKNSGSRGQPAVSTVEPRSACGEHRRTDIGLSTFGPSTFRHRNQRGMTMIEVILAAAIIGILAVAVATALFYPRYLVVNSSLEQSAIHAGTAEIERHLYNHLHPATSGVFRTAGWAINNADIVTTITTNTDTISGDSYSYLVVSNTITYRDGKTVELITYRSLEVSSSER